MEGADHDPRKSRIIVAGLLLGVGFLIILTRLFQLQVLQAGELAQKAGRQHQKVLTVEGERGTIYDRGGKILAMNVDVPSVFGEPRAIADASYAAVRLARALRA